MEKKTEVIKKKWYQKKFLLPLLCVLLILIVITMVINVNRDRNAETQNCSLYSVRICSDDYLQETVYEMAYLYSGAFNYDTESSFIQAIFSGWLSDSNVPKDINTLKLSFYEDDASASNWLESENIIYLFRKE